MFFREYRLRLKSRWWQFLMGVFTVSCSERTTSISSEQLLDPNVSRSSQTRLSLEFRIHRHTYRYGKGSRGFSIQFNVSQVDCIRHFLNEQLQYTVVTIKYYGLSPEEYFYVASQRIHRLGKDSGSSERIYVKKRRYDG